MKNARYSFLFSLLHSPPPTKQQSFNECVPLTLDKLLISDPQSRRTWTQPSSRCFYSWYLSTFLVVLAVEYGPILQAMIKRNITHAFLITLPVSMAHTILRITGTCNCMTSNRMLPHGVYRPSPLILSLRTTWSRYLNSFLLTRHILPNLSLFYLVVVVCVHGDVEDCHGVAHSKWCGDVSSRDQYACANEYIQSCRGVRTGKPPPHLFLWHLI